MAATSLLSALLISILLGYGFSFNLQIPARCTFSKINYHMSPRKCQACALRMQGDSAEKLSDSPASKGFSNRREKQKAEALLRQKSKQIKDEIISPVETDETTPKIALESVALDIKPKGPLKKVADPKSLETLKDSARLEKEKRLIAAATKAGLPFIPKAEPGLPLIEKVVAPCSK